MQTPDSPYKVTIRFLASRSSKVTYALSLAQQGAYRPIEHRVGNAKGLVHETVFEVRYLRDLVMAAEVVRPLQRRPDLSVTVHGYPVWSHIFLEVVACYQASFRVQDPRSHCWVECTSPRSPDPHSVKIVITPGHVGLDGHERQTWLHPCRYAQRRNPTSITQIHPSTLREQIEASAKTAGSFWCPRFTNLLDEWKAVQYGPHPRPSHGIEHESSGE